MTIRYASWFTMKCIITFGRPRNRDTISRIDTTTIKRGRGVLKKEENFPTRKTFKQNPQPSQVDHIRPK